ncbi:MAG: TRAP transporter fused permease subunit, partial [SAR324 cluster bacterium]|nr:TRAP transporter fused permease subunit [SAR324 cluster bacterium]
MLWFVEIANKGRKLLYSAIGVLLALTAVYTAGFGLFDPIFHRSLAVGLSAILVLLAEPLALKVKARGKSAAALWGVDLAMFVGMVTAIAWFLSVSEELESGLYDFSRTDQIVALVGMGVLLELTRRTMGLPLTLFGVLAIFYSLFGSKLPWIFRHSSFSLEETLRTLWYSFDGVFGLPASVMVGFIFVYIVFGVILEGTGAGKVLLKIAFSLTGRLRGGAAHAAILSSALFGSISGSVTANVVATGVFTIPMIKKRGFSPTFAAAVETAASSGGQIMPPVMGAAAFIMSEMTGIPYLTICVAALLPALFYYGSLSFSVVVEARRLGIEPVPPAEREVLTRRDWLRAQMFLVPILVIVGVLVMGRSPAMAGFLATLSALAMGFLNPELRSNPMVLVSSLARAGYAGGRIMVALGVIGMIIGMMNLTGLGLRFSNMVLSLGDGSLLVSLALTMIACLVLGMGMPTVPAYLIIVLVMGPAISELGIPPLLVHLFVLYFGVLSSITPPVAIAAYAAAPIAGSNPIATGVVAVRLALIGFIIPFVFVYNPSLV